MPWLKNSRLPQKSKTRKSFLSFPGPKRFGYRRVPRPIICQNLDVVHTGLKNTRLTTSGTSMPVSSMSTEMAMCGALSACEKSSMRLCTRTIWCVTTRANVPPYSGHCSSKRSWINWACR